MQAYFNNFLWLPLVKKAGPECLHYVHLLSPFVAHVAAM